MCPSPAQRHGKIALEGAGDIALVVSGCNVDDEGFRE